MLKKKSKWKRIVSKTVPCILNKQNKLILPNKALSNRELQRYAFCLKIPFFRGVFMRNDLPRNVWTNETGIVNLDDVDGFGTHWVCYKKIKDFVYYFDSFGNLPPPIELKTYFGERSKIFYNYEQTQKQDTLVCGHLCLEFLATSVSQLHDGVLDSNH